MDENLEKLKCDLCNEQFKRFYVALCPKCNIPIILSSEHKKEFSMDEQDEIRKMFFKYEVDWKRHDNIEHAHAHLIPKLARW